MITVENTALVLLAAGRSARYGDVGSKLDEDFLGKPLGVHVAVTLEDMPFLARAAVVDRCRIDYAAHGFEMIRNAEAAEGIASSVRLGVEFARRHDAAAVMFALADMPRVTAAHVYRMFDVADNPTCVVASSDGKQTKPPGIFGRDRFDFLMSLRGDQGARDLVKGGRHVVTSPAELIDVDTRQELEELRALVRLHPRQAALTPARE